MDTKKKQHTQTNIQAYTPIHIYTYTLYILKEKKLITHTRNAMSDLGPCERTHERQICMS